MIQIFRQILWVSYPISYSIFDELYENISASEENSPFVVYNVKIKIIFNMK